MEESETAPKGGLINGVRKFISGIFRFCLLLYTYAGLTIVSIAGVIGVFFLICGIFALVAFSAIMVAIAFLFLLSVAAFSNFCNWIAGEKRESAFLKKVTEAVVEAKKQSDVNITATRPVTRRSNLN